jgi:hypothetical protein
LRVGKEADSESRRERAIRESIEKARGVLENENESK